MRTLAFITCIWLAQSALADDGFKPLLDGKTFTGWEGNQSAFRILRTGHLSAAASRQTWPATSTSARQNATGKVRGSRWDRTIGENFFAPSATS